MVAAPENDQQLAPIEGPAPADDGPYVTVMLNGAPMRFKAGSLRLHIANGLLAINATINGPEMDAKSKAMIIVLRQAVGLMLPIMRPLVNALRDDPTTPPTLKRMLPPMPVMPRHTDRLMFFMGYLADVIYAGLTENAYALEVEPDEASVHADVVRVTHFAPVMPGDVPHEALELPEPEGE